MNLAKTPDSSVYMEIEDRDTCHNSINNNKTDEFKINHNLYSTMNALLYIPLSPTEKGTVLSEDRNLVICEIKKRSNNIF